jgi:hypothetical protein
MAYVRWSSVVGGAKNWFDIWEEDQNKDGKLTLKDLRELELNQEGAYTSDWYIFWHEDYEGQKEPLLACWNCHCEGNPTLDKEQVEYLLENKNYTEYFGDKVTQIPLLESKMLSWLEDIKENK